MTVVEKAMTDRPIDVSAPQTALGDTPGAATPPEKVHARTHTALSGPGMARAKRMVAVDDMIVVLPWEWADTDLKPVAARK